jgi:hypothetical protein
MLSYSVVDRHCIASTKPERTKSVRFDLGIECDLVKLTADEVIRSVPYERRDVQAFPTSGVESTWIEQVQQ